MCLEIYAGDIKPYNFCLELAFVPLILKLRYEWYYPILLM
jgi:hypothetical protein